MILHALNVSGPCLCFNISFSPRKAFSTVKTSTQITSDPCNLLNRSNSTVNVLIEAGESGVGKGWTGGRWDNLFRIRQSRNNGKKIKFSMTKCKVKWDRFFFFNPGLNTDRSFEFYQNNLDLKSRSQRKPPLRRAARRGEGSKPRCWGTFSWPDEALICPLTADLLSHMHKQTNTRQGISGFEQCTSHCFLQAKLCTKIQTLPNFTRCR